MLKPFMRFPFFKVEFVSNFLMFGYDVCLYTCICHNIYNVSINFKLHFNNRWCSHLWIKNMQIHISKVNIEFLSFIIKLLKYISDVFINILRLHYDQIRRLSFISKTWDGKSSGKGNVICPQCHKGTHK